MQGGLCCSMNHREDCSEATQIMVLACFPAMTVAFLFQGGPVGDMEQIDSYLEALLKEDHLFGNTFNKGSTDAGHSLPLENNESTSQN